MALEDLADLYHRTANKTKQGNEFATQSGIIGLSTYVVRVFAHKEFLISRAHCTVDVFPGFVAWHEERVLFLLDIGFVLIPIGLHACDEVVLSGQLVRFADGGQTKELINKQTTRAS